METGGAPRWTARLQTRIRRRVWRRAVRHYANGDRGRGFPPPVARVTTESPLWSWVDVARWFYRQRRLPLAEVVRARVVQRANAAIASGKVAARSRHQDA